ncbi:MAG TPA: hypothetical protein VEK33_17260 [Terriglobales bacterium]|nr:hypothetical protein [Terriglobales bacterium]
MNQLGVNLQPKNPDCADSMSLAERELRAFFGAATELFGSELAELSAAEWLRELEATDDLPASARDWRWVTAKVSARLAKQMNALSLSTEFATT